MKPLILLPLVLLSACQTSSPPRTRPAEPALTDKIVLTKGKAIWNDLEDVKKDIKDAKGVTLMGKKLDLGGAALDGSKLKRYDDVQDERSEPLRINVAGLTVANGYVRRIPGGVVIKAPDVTFDNVIWLDTGEDSISNVKDQSPRTTVRNCFFYGATDKSLQMNHAKDLVIEGCTIFDGITGVRIGESSSKSGSDATKRIRNNRFINSRTAYNVSRAHVKASGTKYEGVIEKSVTSNGGTFSED